MQDKPSFGIWTHAAIALSGNESDMRLGTSQETVFNWGKQILRDAVKPTSVMLFRVKDSGDLEFVRAYAVDPKPVTAAGEAAQAVERAQRGNNPS